MRIVIRYTRKENKDILTHIRASSMLVMANRQCLSHNDASPHQKPNMQRTVPHKTANLSHPRKETAPALTEVRAPRSSCTLFLRPLARSAAASTGSFSKA